MFTKLLKTAAVMVAIMAGVVAQAVAAEKQKGEISSQVQTGTSKSDGTRVSADSQWTKFTVPADFVINKNSVSVHVLEERGSEHTYELKYEDDTEIVPETGIKQPRTILVKTHAKSAKGPFGGSGKMSVKVQFDYVRFR